jgi:hypothetical protein
MPVDVAGADPFAKPQVKAEYKGCYVDEASFGSARVYSGHTTGAHFSLASHFAISNGKRYVAIARSGTDGHAFAFDTLPAYVDHPVHACVVSSSHSRRAAVTMGRGSPLLALLLLLTLLPRVLL